ncbi:MAG: GDP-mannose 4,6-dehydratase [Candidatus Altiarchaeota archaeon]|nr:GDP-mannose 4,6-dehydratase [Candidatus Altiarchaeota archaeon]
MSFDWGNKKVLITGATGMLGSWIVKELLRRESTVVALVRDVDYQTEFYRSGSYLQTAVVNGSLKDFSTVERAINEYAVDTVFHLGAQTIVGAAYREPLETFDSNIKGTYHILEACRRHRDLVERVVVASSDKAYGVVDKLPYTEDTPLEGCHPYDVSKSCTDLLAQTYFHTYGMPIAIARCGNIYGSGDLNWSRIVPGTIRSLLNNQRPIIRSDGKYVRDYIYLKDVVSAYLNLAESITEKNISGEAFNFSTESRVTVIDIVNRIRSVMGKEELKPKILNQGLKEIREQSLSSEKAHKILGWHPEYDLGRGLSETVQWYKNYLGFSE